MKIRYLIAKTGLLAVGLMLLATVATAQKAPRQEKLLNGLRLVMIDDRAADKVSLRVRIHAGSAFDPQGKEGVMKLLAESFFPTPEAREFFTDDLGGSLEIVSNYDYIQINATSKPSEFLRMLETVSAAVENPTIDKETVTRLKQERLAALEKADKDVSYAAEQAVLARLFGTFPYGRPEMGTASSVQKIDFADLKFAKERFLGADNATVVISGNFDPDQAYRAARRFLGAWLKSDSRVPATFRQPDDPDKKLFEAGAGSGPGEYRFAFRTVSRADNDVVAADLLARVFASRLAGNYQNVLVENRARLLPGVFVLSLTSSSPVDPAAISKVLASPVTDTEFSKAKAEVVQRYAKVNPDDRWLDADTYNISPTFIIKSLEKATLADVERVRDRVLINPMAAVVVRTGSN